MSVKDRITIVRGDLTEQDVDAVVNAANNGLQMGGGVAGALSRKGGPAVQEDCNRVGPIPLGEAAVTTAGELPARCIIHAASMALGQKTSEENLRASTRNSLLRAKEKDLATIAFPAVGAGIAGFPMRRCAEVMLEETAAHLAGETSLEEVRFVLFHDSAYETFREVYEALDD